RSLKTQYSLNSSLATFLGGVLKGCACAEANRTKDKLAPLNQLNIPAMALLSRLPRSPASFRTRAEVNTECTGRAPQYVVATLPPQCFVPFVARARLAQPSFL